MKNLLWLHFGLQRELDIKAAYRLKQEYGLIWNRSTQIQQVLRSYREPTRQPKPRTQGPRKRPLGRSNGYL